MLASSIRFYLRVLRLLAARRVVSAEDIARGYDRISAGYDDSFTSHVAPHSLRMVARLGVRDGDRVMDLGAGTGTLTLALARAVGPRGEVVCVDRSRGMLETAAGKARAAALNNIRFVEKDMLEAISAAPAATLDAVTCGWALGYADAPTLLAAAAGRLKPGGALGIIENTRDTLDAIRRAALEVARRHPGRVQTIMDLHFRLPRGARRLRRWFEGAGLSVREVWEGRVNRRFATGGEALEWVLRTGAGVGFNRMMSDDIRATCDAEFAAILEREARQDGVIEVAHRYVAGTAEKRSGGMTA
ncbi:MAG: methyltransferase domain-containing protein [Lentisphaerae bacterium]|nr:methyltransferase domain-containing protein [Lentisphaerota bacterium]